ncbi:multidrug efflux SMR transporter [Paenibacillus psychroresistens]|uniref:Multidrug efflux SMR transporter n=1 Tax=Paenibacillus psychroresistens TaxID=1778678 RepID=A0A6B8RBC4_9BACL|nr:multidrug efflux SMR transporter [Paenibacillus psychroresistens]QGQ93580.1 multidrug efflux SMR transporter [Paenibacillus psychroresistens]
MGWWLLFLAILFELSGTISMKLSNGFTNLWPSLFLLVFYGLSFFLLSHALKYIEMSVAYATWSGVGIVAIALVAYFYFHEPFNVTKVMWILIIVIGIIGLNMSSKAH